LKAWASTLAFATVSPAKLSGSTPAKCFNHVQGEWVSTAEEEIIPDPLTGEPFISLPATSREELAPFIASLRSCPKSGLHNPLKNQERYLLYGDVSAKAAEALRSPDVAEFFARLIQRVSPKSEAQARAEVTVTQKFLENFSGDQVRFLARSFAVPGNHTGQQSSGYRWPYGPVAIISPFNFPLEIPVLQLMGALYLGNKPLLKSDSKVSVVAEQFLRLLLQCGMPPQDVDLIHCDGPTMHSLLMEAQPRMTQFTGSSRVAEILAKDLHGRVKLEDAGFDWKILGPDCDPKQLDYVAWVCDQDAYACSGQKCSAQSMLFMHKEWRKAGLLERLSELAGRRKLEDLTVGPVLTVTTKRMMEHIEHLLEIEGARLEFGGQPLKDHTIPEQYGAMEPTAVFVPLHAINASPENFKLVTTEIFGPVQVITEFDDGEEEQVLKILEGMEAHLTAAVVSNDWTFLQRILSSTVNGTTYAGIRARTTGAPQNHWFGPAGDPRGAGIGTPEAIQLVWSCHREIISDMAAPQKGWTIPAAT
jgi:1-pyrroline-5-carboxylate dehydrogenase